MKLQIAVDGKTYEVEVEIAEDDTVPRMYSAFVPSTAAAGSVSAAPAAGAKVAATTGSETVADESKVCRSPIAGVVIRVNVQLGQQIQLNDLLMVLEAMKMETNVTAPSAGKVRTIKVQPGDGVQLNQVLVEFE